MIPSSHPGTHRHPTSGHLVEVQADRAEHLEGDFEFDPGWKGRLQNQGTQDFRRTQTCDDPYPVISMGDWMSTRSNCCADVKKWTEDRQTVNELACGKNNTENIRKPWFLPRKQLIPANIPFNDFQRMGTLSSYAFILCSRGKHWNYRTVDACYISSPLVV